MGLFSRVKIIKANIFYNQGNLDEALKIYKNLINVKKSKHWRMPVCLDPKLDDSVKIQAAYVSLNCGDLKYAKLFLDKVNYKNLTKENYKISYKQSESLYLWKTGHIEKAIKNLKKLNSELENTATYETLGYLLIVNSNYEEALEYNKKAYAYNKSNVIIDNLAESYYYLNEIDKAYNLYTEMLENKDNMPNFPEVYYYYGLILKKQNKCDEAEKYFNIALEKKESFLSTLTKEMIRNEKSKINC